MSQLRTERRQKDVMKILQGVENDTSSMIRLRAHLSSMNFPSLYFWLFSNASSCDFISARQEYEETDTNWRHKYKEARFSTFMRKEILLQKWHGSGAHIFPSDYLQALVAINIRHRVQSSRHEPFFLRPFGKGDIHSCDVPP